MGDSEKGKKLVDVSVVDNSIHMELWDGEEKVCYTIFPVRDEDEKHYKGTTNEGKLMNCFEGDFIDDFIQELWDIHDAKMEGTSEIIISPLEHSEDGKGTYLTVNNGQATINFSMGGKDKVYESFNSPDELFSFILMLEDAVKDARESKEN